MFFIQLYKMNSIFFKCGIEQFKQLLFQRLDNSVEFDNDNENENDEYNEEIEEE